MAKPVDYHATLASLRAQQSSQPLSILALAEPLTATASKSQNELQSQAQPQSPSNANTNTGASRLQSHQQPRRSDVSSNTASQAASDMADSFSQLIPTSLSADLAHYKDLFSKLRFSYLEQVTKEKYLRSIVGDPPLVVSHSDNLVLEDKLGAMKAELQAKKRDVDVLVAEIESQARLLAQRYDTVTEGLDVLERVPRQLDQLRQEIAELQAEVTAKKRKQRIGHSSGSDDGDAGDIENDPLMNLALGPTQLALDSQKAANAELDRQIDLLKRQMPAKDRDVEKMDRELAELEKTRNETTRLAVELRRRREQGARDEMEDLGRWYRGSDAVLRGVLGLGVES
ncbi:hypothetical protein A1O3_03525 [Capronia epimyces CBS 606.96]|uniref:Kinetochore protein Sos7 coiled-coil domain-containing protein n=1 Tax=Capronia epimyces CBS 606.96 TaxID=1182542 RepID=W9Y183_9EURO|nr:uncharacterized protein A1O3_03525 [Capronia epimyces CBS 606.96]EXJ86572.1 hypothetical protein A1O3_03525 [Capronia epimyces CBS 606.96]